MDVLRLFNYVASYNAGFEFSVVDLIRVMLEHLDASNLNHQQYQIVKDDRGYTSKILLDKELSLVLATGYSTPLRLIIIRRWQELEMAQPQKTPFDYLVVI